jgi:hypothetical protein
MNERTNLVMVESGEWYWLSMSWSSEVRMDRISFFLYFLRIYLFFYFLSAALFSPLSLVIYFCLSAFMYFFLSVGRSVRKIHCSTIAHYTCLRHLFTTGWNKIQAVCHYQWQGHLVVSPHGIYQNNHFIVIKLKSVTSNKRWRISSFLQPLYFLSC